MHCRQILYQLSYQGNKTKIQHTDWEKVLANDVTDKGLVSKTYKQLMTLNSIKTNICSKNGQRTWIDSSLKTMYRWPIGTWKDVQNHHLFEKCKSKLQWDITSHQLEWLLSKYPQTSNAGEGVERREPSYTVGGNVNWYSHYVEQYAGFLKTKNRATIRPCNTTLQFHSWACIQRKTRPEKIYTPQCSLHTVYNDQDMETTSMSINRGMDKDMVYKYNGILLSH